MPVTLPVTLTKGGTTVTEAVDAGEYVATVAAGDYFSYYNSVAAYGNGRAALVFIA